MFFLPKPRLDSTDSTDSLAHASTKRPSITIVRIDNCSWKQATAQPPTLYLVEYGAARAAARLRPSGYTSAPAASVLSSP
jgi:hypothetical protein